MKCEHCGEIFDPSKDADWDIHGRFVLDTPKCIYILKNKLGNCKDVIASVADELEEMVTSGKYDKSVIKDLADMASKTFDLCFKEE